MGGLDSPKEVGVREVACLEGKFWARSGEEDGAGENFGSFSAGPPVDASANKMPRVAEEVGLGLVQHSGEEVPEEADPGQVTRLPAEKVPFRSCGDILKDWEMALGWGTSPTPEPGCSRERSAALERVAPALVVSANRDRNR